jgi:hypothetical protein
LHWLSTSANPHTYPHHVPISPSISDISHHDRHHSQDPGHGRVRSCAVAGRPYRVRLSRRQDAVADPPRGGGLNS